MSAPDAQELLGFVLLRKTGIHAALKGQMLTVTIYLGQLFLCKSKTCRCLEPPDADVHGLHLLRSRGDITAWSQNFQREFVGVSRGLISLIPVV